MNRPSEKFELIYEIAQDPENTFSIKQLCELNHVSRSGYYSWIHSLEAKAAKEAQDRADFDLILQAFLEHGRKKGARQIYMVLQHMEPPVTFNLKKIRRLCRKYGLECPIRKANPYRRMAKAMRTDSVSDNLVECRFGFSINGAFLKPLKIQVVECHKKNNLNSRMRRNEKWQSNMTKNLRNR
ncbi:IS3 family transposase [Dubosiella newyorkensis]|uniref:IS3 family transposase n=5 Tax=Dubosiella newyorkensis TaxID=1862672 RepID=UPI00235405BF|nr:IS3 family transposase [Dubosiella newyorkensis]